MCWHAYGPRPSPIAQTRRCRRARRRRRSTKRAWKREERGHGFGPPHPQIFIAFITVLTEDLAEKVESIMVDDGQGEAQELKDEKTRCHVTLKEFLAKMEAMESANLVAIAVPYFRIRDAWSDKDTPEEEKRVVLTWCFKEQDTALEKAIMKAIEWTGGVRQVWPPP